MQLFGGDFGSILFDELQYRTKTWITNYCPAAVTTIFDNHCIFFPPTTLGFDDDDPPDRSPANRRMQRIQDNLCAQFLQELVMNGEDISNRMLLMHLRDRHRFVAAVMYSPYRGRGMAFPTISSGKHFHIGYSCPYCQQSRMRSSVVLVVLLDLILSHVRCTQVPAVSPAAMPLSATTGSWTPLLPLSKK
jgi:hypothetical protein